MHHGLLTAVSYTATKEPFDLVPPHLVEIVWHGDLASEETKPAYLRAGWSAKRRYLDDGFPCLRDNERLTLGRFVYKFRELGLRFVNVHSLHDVSPHKLSLIDLV